MHTSIRSRARAGFSLVEMLVVITVIGVIAAIAVPHVHDVTDEAELYKTQRNAQNIANVYSAALAGGADVTGTDKDEIIDKLVAGINGIGAFESHTFVINGLSPDEQNLAKRYLQLEGEPLLLQYTLDEQP